MLDKIELAGEQLNKAQIEIGKVIIGQGEVVALSLITLLSGAHGLLVGLPGLAKTKLVSTLAIVLGLASKRVQFTPDLMPNDILGAEVMDETGGKRSFRFIEGPVFTELLMADEINRASPRTQSALLQAMQEHYVTIAGVRHDLPAPFHVFATQNPIEQEGTYPLPEAQLDRFLMQIDVGYPDLAAEKAMLIATTGAGEHSPQAILTRDDVQSAQKLVRAMPIGETVVDAIVELVRGLRPTDSAILWGPGPRAGQALMLATRAKALMEGRLAPSIDDVSALALPILKHRMALSYSARADGVTIENLITSKVKAL
jgi:MoxR-like ATPase